jgi:hypothetical protein
MVEKFGSDQSQLATFGGGVVSEDGAPLLSGDSSGALALMFGPAALRELQSTIANGDWAITPQDANATITTDNPLPYWSLTNSGSTIRPSIAPPGVHSYNTGTGNALYFTIPPSTPLDATCEVFRYVPIASSQGQAFSYYPEAYGYSNADITVLITTAYYTQDYTYISDGPSATYTSSGYFRPSAMGTSMSAPTNAAFMKVTISCTVNKVGGSGLLTNFRTITEVRLIRGDESLLVSEQTTPGTYAPTNISQQNGTLIVTPAGGLSLPNSTLGQYDKAGSADTTTITAAGTYYALTGAEISFTPQFVGQRWLLAYTGYASLNTTTIQYAFVRADVTDASNNQIAVLGFGRADNFGQSGRGATVAVTKVWVADSTSARKFKLYGTAQTTNGVILSLAYTQMTAYPIG